MARVNYYAIEQAIADLLKADPTLDGVSVAIEEDVSFQRGDIVIIYLDNRTAAARDQGLNAGQRTRMQVVFSIWCWHWGLQRDQAFQGRDDLIGKVEVALMKKRDLSGSVESSWLEGGKFQAMNAQDAFMAGGEIILRADVVATTT